MMQYELYLILNPILGNEAFLSETTKIKELLINKIQAVDLVAKNEGLRKLAYPINKQWTGCYIRFNFNLEDGSQLNINLIEKALNINTNISRYMITNLSEFLVQQAKQTINKTEISTHNELNKANKTDKKCIVKHIGFRVIDYKDTEFLKQFMSPYGKIFGRDRTGVSAKYQRKISKAIKKSRHMGLLPFTAKHMG